MSEGKAAHLRQIPPAGPGGDAATWEAYVPDASGYASGWHGGRAHLGITGFGVNAITADRDQPLVVEHDETSFGNQEELYVVVEGHA